MVDWLDTETKAILQGVPPEKWAPPDTGEFGLVLLEDGPDWQRVLRAVEWVRRCGRAEAMGVVARRRPTVVAKALSIEDALTGQFELVSCDCVAVFLADEVIYGGGKAYLRELFAQVRQSTEFEKVSIEVRYVPSTPEGKQFLEQFFPASAAGSTPPVFPYRGQVMRKKARLMSYWGVKTGADVVESNA